MSDETKDILRAILDAVNVNSAKIEALGERMDRLEGRMTSLETKMDSLETRMDSLETRMTSLETRMDSLETRMTSVESNQQSLQRDLESFRLETAINFRKIDRHVRMIEADLDLTIEKVNVLESSTK